MSYAGNSSLSRDVQQRVLDTFEQTLNLAAEGSRQEALLGCDFVLRMDAQFEPARRLQERLRASSGAIVDLDDLRPSAPPIQAPADLFASLDGLGLDELPDLPAESFAPDLRSEIQVLVEQRRFQELMNLAQQHGITIASDPELQRLLQEVQERMEAEPYVLKFAGQAQTALQAGQTDEVARLLEKARALDPTHPLLAEIASAARTRASQPAPAPAVDFGEIPADMAGFDLSFDSPSLDLDAPAFGSGSGDSDPRIQQLLDEGQRAFDGGDPQAAIDAWSRIFLIDIDHPEAARRIDQARRLKAESERQVEEIFHDGVARLEAGDTAAAKQMFQQVLDMQPGYTAAREYLQQIESGTLPGPRAAAGPSVAAGAAPAADALLSLEGLGSIDDLKEEILVPPDPSAGATGERKAAVKGKAKGKTREGRPRQMFVLVGSVVLLLVLAGGWYVFQNRDQFFPNSQGEMEGGAPAPDPIARAQALHTSGKTASAISQLRRLPESDPHYQQAQALIAQWEATLNPGTGAPGAVPAATTPAPAIPAPQAALLNAARQALAEGSHLDAVDYFEKAAQMGKLGAEETALLAAARQQLQPLSRQIDLFNQHEWDFILNDLWRMHQENPRDRDVTRLIVDSYYNLGVRDLQRSDAVNAAEKFQEAMSLAPDDEILQRHHKFARTYQNRPKDLLYRIYVKYLALR
jgi:tetratricopeptide (TPR) repeat protein